MNRALWVQTLSEQSCPAWPCPACKKGTVALTAGSLRYKQTVKSLRAKADQDWEPDWITYKFTAWGQCGHPSCKEEFAISGTGGVESTYGPEGDFDWNDYFSPEAIHPMPDLIDIPENCPADVAGELRSAFSLFYSHRPACAGRIRVALECLMNHLGVPRKRKDKHGKFYDLTLHRRIEAFARNQPAAGMQLMALKGLGNTGSHDSQVPRDDLLDAFEIMEHALREIIGQHSVHVAKLVKKLTKKHN